MNIGIFTDSYLPYTSGVVRSIQSFSEELIKTGHEVFIFAPDYKGCSDEGRVFRFASIPSPTNPDFNIAVPFSLRFRPTIKRLNLDLIHVHSPFLLGRLGARYARRLDVPLVFTFHTLYDQYVHYVPFARSFTRELAQRISRDFCNQCDMVLVPTDVIGKYLREIGVNRPLKKVPTGIKVDDYLKGDREWLRLKFNIAPENRILLFVGRLGQEKNIGFLLKSFSLINRDAGDAVLVLVGGGPEEEDLKEKATALGIADKVYFTGTLPGNEVINCYAGADVFLFSSVTETQGIVIAEAKAAGLPVVAVGAYGVSEMVDEGADGFLTEEDPVQFSNRVVHILKNKDVYQEMSLQARVNAGQLSVANCTALLLGCYQELLERYHAKRKRMKLEV